MPSIIGDDNTAFAGLEVNHTTPQTYIETEDIGDDVDAEGLINDQAFVRQFITGKQIVSTSTAWSGTAQNHGGVHGAKLGLPLSSSSNVASVGLLSIYNDVVECTYPTIICDQITSEFQRIIYRWPVFIPTGHSKCIFRVEMSPSDGAQLVLSTQDTSFAQENLYSLSQTRPEIWTPSAYETEVTFSSTNTVYILSLEAFIQAAAPLSIRGVFLLPIPWRRAGHVNEPAQIGIYTGRQACVRGSTWRQFWDTYTAAGRALGSNVTYGLAENDAMLLEHIGGGPAPGYETAATPGHDHSGANGDSRTIGLSLASTPLGCAIVNADNYNGLTTSQGKGIFSPYLTDQSGTVYDTWKTASYGQLQTPQRDTTPFTVNFGLVFCTFTDEAQTVSIKIDYSTDTSFGSSSSTLTQVVTDDANYWYYKTGTLSLASGTLYNYRVQFKYSTQVKPNEVWRINHTGLNWWVT